MDGGCGDRDVERLTPRADYDADIREIALQSLDLGTCSFSRCLVKLIPAVERQNEGVPRPRAASDLE